MDWKSLLTENLLNPGTILGALTLAILMGAGAMVVSRTLTRLLSRPRWVVGRLKRKVDKTVITYVIRFKTLVIFLTFGLIYASMIPGLKGLMGTMMAGAGVTAIVVGFAAKSTLANLISGLSLAVYRPFRIGDKVSLDNEYGTVEDITLRHTIVRTWRHRRLIIPNEKIDNMSLINYSIVDPLMLCTVELGISYDSDIDLARRLILEEANNCPHRLEKADEPWVRVVSHGDFAIGLRLYVWVEDADAEWLVRYWLLENIKKRFDREGMEIPFPYRTIVYKKDMPPPLQEEAQPVLPA